MANVILKDLAKYYDKTVAVERMNLEIKNGEFLVLVGPSGCGKSTTLRMIGGLEVPSEGEIYIGDRNVTELEPKDRNIAMVFQNYALYPHKKVFDNLAFGLSLRKIPKKEIKKRVNAAAEMLGISEYFERFPKQLSGGQRQRVALGRAIVRHPDVFLMDEPLSNLDARLRIQMRTELIKLHRELQTTTIYVTHDQIEAMTMGTRIVVLKEGVVQQVGTPREIYREPENIFVAGFIGTPPMNFITGSIETSEGSLFFKNAGMRIELPGSVPELPENKEVILGIRPESLVLVKGEGEDEKGVTLCRVEVVEHIGSEAIIHSKLLHDDYRITTKINGYDHIPSVGEIIRVKPHLGNIHLFDSADGTSLASMSITGGR